MSDTSKIDRDALLSRLRELIAMKLFEYEDFVKSGCEFTATVDGIEMTGPPFDGLDLESLSNEELAILENGLREVAHFRVYSKTPKFRIELEHAAFAEYLKERQGTQLPDFKRFYREREQLDGRISPPAEDERLL